VINANQLVAHAVGDYLLQSDWEAGEKTKAHLPAAVHAITYALPFLALTRSPWRLAAIAGTHFVIDRWRLARYVCWLKNFIGPIGFNKPWSECSGTGYPSDKPAWLAVWLLIIADNTLHALINGLILRGAK
jgi:hypothetical protein